MWLEWLPGLSLEALKLAPNASGDGYRIIFYVVYLFIYVLKAED